MSDEPKAPLTTTTSLLPAAAILGLAVIMLIVFLVINLAANQGVTKETTTIPLVVGGLQLDKTPSAALKYCLQSEEVPTNITDAFVMPVRTVPTGGANTPNSGAGDFDCYEPLATSSTNSASLINFFNAQLEARGWNLFSKGSSTGQPQSLFQKAGNDGFYWVVGVTVTKSNANSVDWTYRIYQNSETI
ncbi:MAG TPA: hypothetical protein VIJ40_03675 [Acidimicrobiales bacterium]